MPFSGPVVLIEKKPDLKWKKKIHSIILLNQRNDRKRVTHRAVYFCIMLYLVPSFEWQWFDVQFALELGL